MNHKAGFIAVVGRPNVGKSTLTNELIGQKLSITSHRPQTTRHRIHAIDTSDDYQMVFVDTPGMHIGNAKAINAYMNRTASASINDVDIILWLIEAGKWTKEDARVLEHVSRAEVPVILCVNKIDKLKSKQAVLPFLEKIGQKYQPNDFFPLSAFKKPDTQALRTLILKYLPEQDNIFDPDYVTDRSEKFIVAEFIREKLMRHLEDELPYDLTVEIEQYELDGTMQRISARILVEKASQKNIVIGNKGDMLKLIGTEARKSIEGFLGRKVFLKLWVKVSTGWSDDKRALASLGYD
ncbi:GTP-binding protein Era [Bathymodiolus thermophilus thioautotrophic gill symbiont]|uniref:GTPase Era n=1 Tax=Bathymodiolus thermophilus thioautotrophic gill symbiont TaxID=2360 RepID=A0A1J5UCV0_9GAMM|nr:GTPase Era [Bathymodiolus thermophilus thioautotrophic gill symbiont]AYQ56656.1 GTPase Era [Bathymodiolus thermophilus thioautotrophic gill symbiont]OIR23749.1 GTPase Era [Bathymodiolus thermophilus thioautotrophic gill symbiont]CAB5503182.1 GTP-binding protein Era [Bathymodiolus thermophilus thioautotrophic gill symbiont]SHA24520.1 GTP-binding protein Era [Bathymodiolus thermophilus thioautotrophic gill symbiont]